MRYVRVNSLRTDKAKGIKVLVLIISMAWVAPTGFLIQTKVHSLSQCQGFLTTKDSATAINLNFNHFRLHSKESSNGNSS